MELHIIHGWRFLESLLSLLHSCVFLSLPLSLSVIPLKSKLPPPPLPLCTGFWPRACHFTEADFPRLPKGYFTRIPIRSLPITNVPNHLQKNLFTLCGNSFIWLPQKKRTFNMHFTLIQSLTVFSTFSLFDIACVCLQNHPQTVLSITVQYCTMERCRSLVAVLQEKQV